MLRAPFEPYGPRRERDGTRRRIARGIGGAVFERRIQPMINIVGAIISGLIIGALARFFYPGAVAMGWIATILLGISGSPLPGPPTPPRPGPFSTPGCPPPV